MSHASAIRPAWADEYPEFYKHQSSGLGELLRVDEFNVPYWSGYPTHVWIRASHPIIQCERRVLHDQSEMNALDKLLQKYDEINAREQEQCALESEKLFLLKQPRPFEIKFYEEAKSIFMSEQNIIMPSLKTENVDVAVKCACRQQSPCEGGVANN